MDSPAAEQVSAFQSVLCEKYELLSRCLVVTPGLLFKLKSNKYLRDTIPQIRLQTTADTQVTELLFILDEVPESRQQSVYNTFLSALRHCGQEHVANLFKPESNVRHMSDEHYKLLFSKRQQICQNLDSANGLLDELFERHVFTYADCRNIDVKTEHGDMSRELINILLCKPDSAFDSFISALVATKQEPVASLLGHTCSEKPMTDEHRQLLIRKQEELGEFISPTRTLLKRLEAEGMLNKRDIDDVARNSSYTAMSIVLVNILLSKSDNSFDKFIEALNNTEQQHVVHILTGQGETPLSRLRRLVLRKARKKLVSRLIDTMHTSLLAELISSGVLTDSDKERIEARNVNEDRTAQLIDVIARKSQNAYDKFLQALRDSGHVKVADILQGLELKGLVDPHFLNETPSSDRNRIIEIVRNNMKALVTGKGNDMEEIANVMEQNGFAVSDVSEGSIHISFRCFTMESVVNLKRLYTDKTLDKLFTKVFCPEFAEQGLESLTLHITDEEFENLTKTFSQMDAAIQISDNRQRTVNNLPVELLELVFMRAFIKLFIDHYKTHEATRLAYNIMAGVCYNWWLTMNGWPQSITKHWFKYKLHRAMKFVCRPFVVSPRLQFSLPVRNVSGVTHCCHKIFIVCELSNTILVFEPNSKLLTNIELEQLNSPRDIASCAVTRQLYVADVLRDSTRCVWRVSLDGRQVVKWQPNNPARASKSRSSVWKLSVTSRRLLVTSQDKKELLLFGEYGVQLKRFPLPHMASLQHAVETSRGTFIVSQKYPQPRVCEVNFDCHVTRVYCDPQQLSYPAYLSLDSDGRIFVADWSKHRILLLNSETLELERVLLDRHYKLSEGPRRLCYSEQTGQLAVACYASDSFQLFTVR